LTNFSTKFPHCATLYPINPALILKNLGLSEKAAQVYLASLELGEAPVQKLAERAGLKRTTVYYVLEELVAFGALVETKQNKKIEYVPAEPSHLLQRAKERLNDFETALGVFEERRRAVYPKPQILLFYGPAGFKEIWSMIFSSGEKEFRIITPAQSFLGFVKEKYIIDWIIKEKKLLGIKSKQLISDTPYARQVVAKDHREGRQSKFLPKEYPLPFTEIITKEFVAFISSRFDNMLFVVQNDAFAKTRTSLFELLWEKLQKPT